jgi:ribosomal protein S18 acetylase RimI-like enzyme
MTINPKRIEEISLNSWPALQQVLYDGWVLRLSKGYTKRANSVNPLYLSTLALAKKVAFCEKFYRDRSLRPVFRLTPFSSPPELDQYLEQRGYQVLDRTSVMVLDLEIRDFQTRREIDILNTDLDEWIEIFYQISHASLAESDVHKEILSAISTQRYLVALTSAGAYAACGLGVLEGEYVGLFDIVTEPEMRRRGFATHLVLGILRWAQEQGARYAYLQVAVQNAAGRMLYEKIGFKELYRYWYRVSAVEIPGKSVIEP